MRITGQATTSSSDAEIIPRLAEAHVAIVNKIGLTLLADCAAAASADDRGIRHRLRQDRHRCLPCTWNCRFNIRGYAADTVPEHTFALILALRRSPKGFQADMEAGAWQDSTQFCLFTQPVNDLKGTTLGLIGSGAIGSVVGWIAKAFGMRVIKAARKSVGNNSIPAGYTAFEEVIKQADVISLHCPLTPETDGLIAAPEFAPRRAAPF